MIEIRSGIWINEEDLSFQAVRSSGPGGQHVNKVSSKVICICPIQKISGLNEHQKEILQQKLKSYISNEEIRISSQKHRSQHSNKLDTVEKLQSLLQNALKDRKPRYKTNIPKAAKEKRLKEKSKRSQVKSNRRFDPTTDD